MIVKNNQKAIKYHLPKLQKMEFCGDKKSNAIFM